MTHEEKIAWMAQWAARNRVTLDLQGECGFGRECVGITVNGDFPDYEWYDDETYERIDQNGEVWTPEDAYHKHPCVAVLGRGEEAEAQLYDWLKWFDTNNFTVETYTDTSHLRGANPSAAMILMAFGKHQIKRMVRQGENAPKLPECGGEGKETGK